jgi:hypothetical protein
LPGRVQANYQHRVPEASLQSAADAARVNITFRWIKRHQSGCECAAGRVAAPRAD